LLFAAVLAFAISFLPNEESRRLGGHAADVVASRQV
jgi:hypothetical protein